MYDETTDPDITHLTASPGLSWAAGLAQNPAIHPLAGLAADEAVQSALNTLLAVARPVDLVNHYGPFFLRLGRWTDLYDATTAAL
jgi:hypothetical protein